MLLGVGEVEQHVAVGMEGRAVVEQQRRARGEARDQPVPHHPAAGGEVEHAVAGSRCRQCSRCSLRCCSSVPPADGRCISECRSCPTRTGCRADARRAAARRSTGFGREGRERVVQRHGAAAIAATACARRAEIVDDDRLRARVGSFASDRLRPWRRRRSACRCTSSRRRDEDDRLDLAEAVEHALLAEIGRAGRPDRAERGGGQHGGDGLGHVRHHRGDAVALLDAERREAAAAGARPARAARPTTGGARPCPRPGRRWRRRRRVLRSRFSAKFSRASGKNCAPGIRSPSTSSALALVADRRRRSPRPGPRRPRGRRPTSGAARHRTTAPCRRRAEAAAMNAVNGAAAIRSGDGVQSGAFSTIFVSSNAHPFCIGRRTGTRCCMM